MTTDKEREDLRRVLKHRIEAGTGGHSDKIALSVLEERDDLVAHVVRVYDAWNIDDTGIHDKRVEHVRLPYLRYEAVNQAIMAAPITSLGRRNARMKAEALDALLFS